MRRGSQQRPFWVTALEMLCDTAARKEFEPRHDNGFSPGPSVRVGPISGSGLINACRMRVPTKEDARGAG